MKERYTHKLPKTQHAVQLVGPDKLVLNKSKEVFRPGRHQILCRIEVVGLCFSDLKLLKQFSNHARKSNIISGIDLETLKHIPSYVPGDCPTVPGHETVIKIEAVGPDVEKYKVGQRYLVQTDYRWLVTANSNAAFGYNFEGALQEYVLMDQRVITSPEGDSMLIPVSEELSASAIALIEPWACVEDAYMSKERRNLKENGKTLIVADIQLTEGILEEFFKQYRKPLRITWISKFPPPVVLENVQFETLDIEKLVDFEYDDIIYFGSNNETVEILFAKLAAKGLINIVLCGNKFTRNIKTPVGRIHYGSIRIIGTMDSDPAESMKYIPQTSEIRDGDKINVIGAGGPMGLMHVVRNICHGFNSLSIFASDIDDNRLEKLTKTAGPLAEKNNVEYKPYNSKKEKVSENFDYTAIMTPVSELVIESVKTASGRGIINIFAGIPANIPTCIDLNFYIQQKLYFVGTSGSTIQDMKVVLEKVEKGKLDTNTSVGAVCSLDGAIEGIRAVENRSIAGKIIVFPACKGLDLITLEELSEKIPEVARCLNHGMWTKQAERKLLEIYKRNNQ